MLGRGDRTQVGDIGPAPRTKRVIGLVAGEARRLGHPSVEAEHVLLGIIREGEGIAAGVLESLGVPLRDLVARVEAGLRGPETQNGLGLARGRAAWEYVQVRVEGDRWRDSRGRSGEIPPGMEFPLLGELEAPGMQGWELGGVASEPSGARRRPLQRTRAGA